MQGCEAAKYRSVALTNLVQGDYRLVDISDVKVNESEAVTLSELTQPATFFPLEKFCRYRTSAYNVATICVTLGGEGCAIFKEDALQCFAGFKVKVADTVGAGDAFTH